MLLGIDKRRWNMGILRFRALTTGRQRAYLIFLAFVSLSASLTGSFLLPKYFSDLQFLLKDSTSVFYAAFAVLTVIFLSGMMSAGLFIIPSALFSFQALTASAIIAAVGENGCFRQIQDIKFPAVHALAVFAVLLLSFRGFTVSGAYSLARSRSSRYARTQRKLFFAEYAALIISLLLIYFFTCFTV